MKKQIPFLLLILAGLLAAMVAGPVYSGGGANGPPLARFLVFTNDDPVVNEAARQGVADQGGRVLVTNHVAPDTAMIAVLIPDGGAGQLASIPGVRGVSRDLQATALCHRGGSDPKGCGGGDDSKGFINGTVTNSSDSNGIEGANVKVDTGQSAFTASDGTYTITEVPTGDRLVTAEAAGFSSEIKTAVVAEKLTTTVDFALDPVAAGGEQLAWGVDRIDADMVWSDDGEPGIGEEGRSVSIAAGDTITGADVIVAIMDSGIDLDHPDLVGNVDVNGDKTVDAKDGHVSCINGACSSTAGAGGDAIDDHGTHVAGIVAAVDNDIGVIGTAPQAKLLSINIFDGGGAFFSDVIAGYQYLVIKDGTGMIYGRRADVVNQSFGYSSKLGKQCPSCVTALQAVVNDAWDAGIVLVAAAGNAGNGRGKGDNVGFPARLDNEVAVAATDKSDNRASFSSTGPDLDVTAPGVAVLSTLNGGGYGTKNGTSMASPHVAGAAALVIHDLGTGWTNTEVVKELIDTADDFGANGFDTLYGWGLIDAQQASTGTDSTP